MQTFHEPPSRRPHCSSTQQWVTPELGLSSTPGQGIQTQAEVTGNSVTHNHQEERSPGISHTHCPQTLIPHMPVPPQESAPSLSPGQSFGCQSPLPWVTGTDRTGSLRVLWQLQGSFQELSPSSMHSLTWRESLTGQQASHSPELCATTNTGKWTQIPKNQHSLTWRESLTGQQASRRPELCVTTNTGKMDTDFPRTSLVVTGCSLSQDFRIGIHAQARSAFPNKQDSSPKSTQASRMMGLHAWDFSESDTDIRVTRSHKGSLSETG
jgi:hypothetical protein